MLWLAVEYTVVQKHLGALNNVCHWGFTKPNMAKPRQSETRRYLYDFLTPHSYEPPTEID